MNEAEQRACENIEVTVTQPWGCDFCNKVWHEQMHKGPDAEVLRIIRLKSGEAICEECIEEAVKSAEE